MRISLVVPTVGRKDEIRRLLASLQAQTHRDFEVIIVDQNPDSRLAPVVAEFVSQLDLKHVPLAGAPAASRARNVGIARAMADVVCFPDDDCWYPPDYLTQVDSLLTAHPSWDAILGEATDESGSPILPWIDRPGQVTKPICWRRAICIACVVRWRVLQAIGGFDETLGPGAGTPWGSGEDNDLMLRAIEHGFHVQYDKRVRVFHALMFRSFDDKSRAKRYSYSLGDGRMLRKHPMPVWWRLLFFGVPVGRTLVAILKFARDETLFHWTTYVGRLKGFRLSE